MLNRILLTILLTFSFNFTSLADNDGKLDSKSSSIAIDFIQATPNSGQEVCYLFLMNTGNVDLSNIQVSLSNPDGFSSDDLGIKKTEFTSSDLRIKQFMSVDDLEANGGTTFWAPFTIPNGKEVNLRLKVETTGGTFHEQVKFTMKNGKIVSRN